MILGQAVKAWRIERRISLRKLGKSIGVDHSTLDRFEQGNTIKSDLLANILLWLIAGKGEK